MNAHPFMGEIDDVRVYNRALPPADIAALASQKWTVFHGRARETAAKAKFGTKAVRVGPAADYVCWPDSPDFKFGSNDHTIARQDSAAHFCAMLALRCTAVDWILITA